MSDTIFHNPRCTTSRNVLAALEEAGRKPQVVEYLKAGWTEPQLKDLFAKAGLTPRQALRMREPLVEDLGLAGASDAAVLKAMVEHPILVERPFVVTDKGAALCRPADKLQSLL